ncbi:MAG: hypothetical protein NTW16_00895 [Bacteroidetes bacterium]|nr:hypothetical protein [Bacteroidota bacterium]
MSLLQIRHVSGATNSSYSFVPANGNVITCVLTSRLNCALGSPATSNSILMTITPAAIASVSIAPSLNPVCIGTSVTFTATANNGGASPLYTWRVNGTVITGATNPTYTCVPANYDAVTCQLTSNATCNNGIPVISNQVAMSVKAQQPVGVTISTPSLTFCTGAAVTFTAYPVNGGTAPLYQWLVDGVPKPGATNSTYIFPPVHGNVVKCVLTSNQICINNNPDTSNALTMIAGTGFPVSVSISADFNPVCPGTTVYYTAVPLNGGSTPGYRWKVNGMNGPGNATLYRYEYIPSAGDVISCVMTSSLGSCVINNPDTSNYIEMHLNPAVPVSVEVTPAANPSCVGSSVCFFATVMNVGTAARYRWKVNDTVKSSLINNPSYCYFPRNGDKVVCQIVPDTTCPAPNLPTSNVVTMDVRAISTSSVTISASLNPVCEGSQVTYLATPVNGGTLPMYQWKVNGNNAAGPTTSQSYTYPPVNTDVVTNVMTSNAFCVSSNVVPSNPVEMTVSPFVPVSVSIAAAANPVCQGMPATFVATPQHGGSIPHYQWMVNGIDAGTNSSLFSYVPSDGNWVTCKLTSNDACTTGNPAISNTIEISVTDTLQVTVAISASENPDCQGHSIIYTARPENGGTSPLYQWLVNGMIVGANSEVFTYVPSSGDVVACHLTSNVVCASGNPALSNPISMIFWPVLPVSISINCSANPACQGTSATFTATAVNGGSAPVYQWKVNDTAAGGNQPFFAYNPANGDVVTCKLIPDIPCPSSSLVASNSVTMSVLPPQTGGVSISASANPACADKPVTFTANALNGGASPGYQWKVNGINVGSGTAAYAYYPLNEDVISCQLTSGMTCVINNPVTSNEIMMEVGTDFPVSVTITPSANPACSGQRVYFTATPKNGGINPVYQWSVNGISVGSNSLTYSCYPSTGDVIGFQLASSFSCATGSPAVSNDITMTVNPILPVSVSIGCSSNPGCLGIPINYTANVINGGPTPFYQWNVNGLDAGANLSTFIYAPGNGDSITCRVTSSEACVSHNPDTSNQINMIVGSTFPVSVAITASDNPICVNTPVTYTATSSFGGPTPVYQWYVNELPVGTNSTTFSYFPAHRDSITCVMTSILTCGTGNPAASNTIGMTVLQTPVMVTIDVDPPGFICAGTSLKFTCHPVNGGDNPTFQWKVNDTIRGTNDTIFSYLPADGDSVTCTLMSNATCVSGNDTTSLPITTHVNPNLPVTLAINADPGEIVCAGTEVIYTASATNEGSMSVFQWNVNGNDAGLNSPTFRFTPSEGDIIQCALTSNVTCAIGSPATSNSIAMTVNPNPQIGISVSASINPVCAGTQTTLTAIQVNAGSTAVFQWQVNGLDVGTNSPAYSYEPVNGDVVRCIVSANDACLINNPATSNTVEMVVNPVSPVEINVTATPSTAVCAGTFVTLNASVSNEGANPVYLWKVNGTIVGSNDMTYGYVPFIGDLVSCQLTSDVTCSTNNPATDTLTILLSPSPVVRFNACNDLITSINGKPIKLKGGLPLGGEYQGNGVINGFFDPVAAGFGLHQITYSYTNTGDCSSSASVSINVRNEIADCGMPVTDYRDNQTYPTVLIGTQCWFTKNLNIGAWVNLSTGQTDNCIIEKYCMNNLSASCESNGGLYEWDELMWHDPAPGGQGLCPAGWHVPTDQEWLTLLNYYGGRSVAGDSLKNQQNGSFRASPGGVLYQNHTWSFDPPDLAVTFFWTSEPEGLLRAKSHGMNSEVSSVSDYRSGRGNGFSVRCLRDQ